MSVLDKFVSIFNAYEKGLIESSKPILREKLTNSLRVEAQKVADEFVVEYMNRVEIRAERLNDVTRFIFEVKDEAR